MKPIIVLRNYRLDFPNSQICYSFFLFYRWQTKTFYQENQEILNFKNSNDRVSMLATGYQEDMFPAFQRYVTHKFKRKRKKKASGSN